MNRWSVIIPSRHDRKVIDCVVSLFDTHPELEADQVVIVSDGLERSTRKALRGVRWVKGKRPFVFSRAINMGVEATDPRSDLVILGDDVRFKTRDGVETLHSEARIHNVAAIAPEVLGLCGQRRQAAGARESVAAWLAFICVYIPRSVWDAVGELDERFVGYGYDDVDWCLRAAEHGPLRIAHDVRVHHLDNSSYRSQPDWLVAYRENRERFEQKWHDQLKETA